MSLHDASLALNAFSAPWRLEVEFYLVSRGRDGARALAEPPTFRPLDDQGGSYSPTFSLSPAEAQQLMDTLWDAGIRPTQAAGTVGQLNAVERHLTDLREINQRLLAKVLSEP